MARFESSKFSGGLQPSMSALFFYFPFAKGQIRRGELLKFYFLPL